MYLVFSTSLNPASRSRILARKAAAELEELSDDVTFLDIAELELPACDGDSCYRHPNVELVRDTILAANGILVACPIYNYAVSSSAKNLIEVAGKAWTEKIVGFLCASGGSGSFMAPMGIANSLMLDFRTLILPRFVYATGESFTGEQISDTDCEQRIHELVHQLYGIAEALQQNSQENS